MKTPSETTHRPGVSPLIQRLLGAAVLVAIALVAVPALFDFSRHTSPGIEEGLVPPRPDDLRVEVLPLPASRPPVVPRQQIDAEIDGLVPRGEAPRDEVRKAAVPANGSRVEGGSRTRASKSAASPPAVKARAPATTHPASSAVPSKGWAVQVGSFGREANARRQLARIEKIGLPAFQRRSTRSGKTLIRVLAGPVATRREAVEIKRRIKASIGIDGLIVTYRAKAR